MAIRKSVRQKIAENRIMLQRSPFRQELPVKRGPVAYTLEGKLRALRKAGIGIA